MALAHFTALIITHFMNLILVGKTASGHNDFYRCRFAPAHQSLSLFDSNSAKCCPGLAGGGHHAVRVDFSAGFTQRVLSNGTFQARATATEKKEHGEPHSFVNCSHWAFFRTCGTNSACLELTTPVTPSQAELVLPAQSFQEL